MIYAINRYMSNINTNPPNVFADVFEVCTESVNLLEDEKSIPIYFNRVIPEFFDYELVKRNNYFKFESQQSVNHIYDAFPTYVTKQLDTTIAGVYGIVNSITGERYIGQSFDIESRWYDYLKDEHRSITNAIAKYGIGNFRFYVLEDVVPFDNSWKDVTNASRLKLLEAEHKYITKYNTVDAGYNMKYETDTIEEFKKQEYKVCFFKSPDGNVYNVSPVELVALFPELDFERVLKLISKQQFTHKKWKII